MPVVAPHDLFPQHRRVELGSTFFRPDARGGVVNPASKRLLLQHAFDSGVVRVEIITHTGRVRDTVMFSITDEDWPAVRGRLDARLAAF